MQFVQLRFSREVSDRVMGASSFALFVAFSAICVGFLVVGQLFLPNGVVTTIQPTIVSTYRYSRSDVTLKWFNVEQVGVGQEIR